LWAERGVRRNHPRSPGSITCWAWSGPTWFTLTFHVGGSHFHLNPPANLGLYPCDGPNHRSLRPRVVHCLADFLGEPQIKIRIGNFRDEYTFILVLRAASLNLPASWQRREISSMAPAPFGCRRYSDLTFRGFDCTLFTEIQVVCSPRILVTSVNHNLCFREEVPVSHVPQQTNTPSIHQ